VPPIVALTLLKLHLHRHPVLHWVHQQAYLESIALYLAWLLALVFLVLGSLVLGIAAVLRRRAQ
jgi:hypothetical protein